MPSLRQLLAKHRLCLVVDTCSSQTEAVLWKATDCDAQGDCPSPQTLSAASIAGEASAALPSAVSRALAAAGGLCIGDLDAAAFCDGPGSVLGVRLAAATLRSWRAAHPALALYSFHSLPLLAVVESKNNGATIIADARRDTWHAVRPDSPHMLLRLATAELATLGALATPDNFRRWSALPEGVHPSCVAYSAASLLTSSPDEPFFAPASEPDAFMHEPPSYVAWTPHIHQAQSTRAAG